jgi:hypothetical protein
VWAIEMVWVWVFASLRFVSLFLGKKSFPVLADFTVLAVHQQPSLLPIFPKISISSIPNYQNMLTRELNYYAFVFDNLK